MADGTIAIDEPTTIDKRLDTESLTVGANTVERERVQIAGAAALDIAPVTAANGLDVDVTRLSALVAGTALIGQVRAGPSGTATLANVASSATSVALQASNTARLGWFCYNDSTQILYINFGATASTTAFTVRLLAEAFYEMPQPVYTGALNGIWVAANGNARVTELT